MSKSIRRLVDYFLVVSFEQQQNDSNKVSESKTNNNLPEFHPTIAARYPLEDHIGTPLHESVTCFCHPQGNVKLRKVPPNLPKVHYFVMTGARGGLMYGTCLTIYVPYVTPAIEQPIPESCSSATPATDSGNPTPTLYLPKCVCLLSSFPYLIAYREYLIQLQRLISSGEMNIPIERYITNICYEVPAPPPGSLEIQTSILDSVITFWSLPHNLPIAWTSLPFSMLFECLNTDNILSIWLALVLERQILFTSTQLSLLTICCEILTSLTFPLKWSHAYIPVLPKFLLPILSAPMPFICGIHKENLPEALLNVSSECIIVDLDKNNINMGPMTPGLPCLPLDYEDTLRYMLEKHAGRYFREARSFTKNENLFEKGVPLANDLKKIGQAVWESKLMMYDDASMLVFTNNAKSDYLNGNTGVGQDLVDSLHNDKTGRESLSSQGVQKQSNWDAVQETFLSFFISVLRNYREHMIYPSKTKDSENVASYDGAGFLSKDFVKAERYDIRDFLNQLLGTQMWDEFVTKRLYGSSSPDVIFFDDAVNRFSKLSAVSLFMGRRKLSMDKYLEKSNTKRKNKSGWASFQHARAVSLNLKDNTEKVEEFLLQSAKVRARLKTMVSPEPLLSDLSLNYDQQKRKSPVQSYIYKEFPSLWDMALLGNPRPLPLSAFVEFDNQRENTVKFRRRKITEENYAINPDPSTLAEIATFTLFFVSFTSVVGHHILLQSESSIGTHLAPIPRLGDGPLKNKVPISSPRSTLEGTESSKRSTDAESGENSKVSQEDFDSINKQLSPRYETSRIRFQHSRKYLEIEESKAKAKAALGLAFDILECMKMRNLKADPESYQCLMDACGKCGDTQRVSQLLLRMHEDGIVADSAVYSSLVTAFSSDTVLNTNTGVEESSLPEWANGVSFTMDWNKLSLIRRPKDKAKKPNNDENTSKPRKSPSKLQSILHIINKHQSDRNDDSLTAKRPVTDSVMRQIVLGESVLEMVYPGIQINADSEVCPYCNLSSSDNDIIKGWSVCDSQDYTAKCHLCSQKFVPHFRVQSSSPSFRGSKGIGTPLFVQRLSPWVLSKELRTVINDNDGVDSLLDPKWRERESKNEVLWWNLILSFMRFRLPFAYLLQGSVEQSLLVPSPSDDI